MPERHPIDVAIDARRRELRLRWRDLYDRSVSHETMRKLRNGLRDDAARTTETERKVEDALGWAHGSIHAIRNGGQPTELGTSAPPNIADPAERAIMEDPDLSDNSKQLLIKTLRTERKKP